MFLKKILHKCKKKSSHDVLPIKVYLFDDNSEERIYSKNLLPKGMNISVDPSLVKEGVADTNVLRIHKKFKARGLFIIYTMGCTNSLCVLEESGDTSGIAAKIIMMSGDKNELKIDKFTAMNNPDIYLGNGSKLFIGKNCIFSYDIVIRTTDGHTILDNETKEIINEQKNPCIIGNHCWIGLRTIINKNVVIPDNTIIGSGSVVTSRFNETYTVIAGNPAKVIKTGVTFDENTIYMYKRGLLDVK